MAEKQNTPEIRFEGFTDPWEQRKLGEVAHRVIRKNEGNQSDLPLTISAQHGLVDQRDYFNNQVASRDMSGYYLLENGEFAYNKSTSGESPWGAIKRLTKYEKGCLSTLYICFGLDQGDPDFLVTYYETNRWHGAVQMIAAEGARNHGLLNIAPNDFFETSLTLPCSTEEQKQIGCFFTQLNSLITLHQRKCQYRGLYGYLSWEQRKLGELGRIETGNTPPTDNEAYYQVDGMPWATPTDIDGTPWLRTEKALSELGIAVARTVPAGSILCTCIASIGKNAITQTTCGFNQQINALAPKKDYYDSYFLFTESVIWSDQMKKSAAAATIQIVNKTEFSNLETSVPSLEEQRQIGSFFAELDNLITLHQREPPHTMKEGKNANRYQWRIAFLRLLLEMD